MGRHAAPDDDPDDEPTVELAAEASGYTGTHAEPDPEPESVATPAQQPRGTRADLALLRARRGVRWSCLAALLAVFALYTLVMALTNRMDGYALWLWIPIVVSGVAVGVVLDVAHQRAG